MGKRYSLALIFIFCATVSLFAWPVSSAPVVENPHILMINSYHQRLPWVQDIVQGVEDVLQPDENSYFLHIENMDSKEFHSEAYFAMFKDYLAVKYNETDIHLILSSDNNAYDFLRTYRDRLFPGVPVVFCGVNNFDEAQIADLPAITGATELFSADTTVKLALQLIPELKRLYVVNDYLKTGRFWEADIRKQLKSYEGRIEVEYNDNFTLPELLEHVASLPADAAVLLGTYFSDGNGKYYPPELVASQLSQAGKLPVFSLVEFLIDEGLVGGQVISGYYQGRAMAELAEKILQGTEIAKLPVVKKGSNKAIFNHQQLERHGLQENNLPQDAVVINRPFSFYETYRQQIWMVVAFFGILLVAIILLIANVVRRKHAERALRRSEKRFRQLADATWEALIIHDNGVLLEANQMFEHVSGYSVEEMRGTQVVPLFFPEEYQKYVQRKFATSDSDKYEAMARDKSGRVFPIEVRVRYIEYEGKEVRVAALRDLTERKHMEEQLTQSRKLEAIGTLAGGIAHDFNNILSAIIGYAEILLLTKKSDHDTSDKLQQILNAGNRAKHLVQQILTFARKTEEQQEPIQLSTVVHEVVELMRASLPASVQIKEMISTEGCILGDMTKMHQIVMNLCTNAGKAMPDGGLLEVSLAETILDDGRLAVHPEVAPRRFLQLTVRDTGRGIAPESKAKIFDPFFTIDGEQKGTGLGLAVVHGVVKEGGGFVEVESKEGEGTSFFVYLPCVDCLQRHDKEVSRTLPGGNETIMVIDDEKDLIQICTETLSSLGYRVQGFTNSREAVKRFAADPDAFDLVITDMTMPEMSGEVVARKLLAIKGNLPIIVCSGYSETFHEDDAKRLGIKRYLVKPVATKDLALQVRGVLDEKNN